MVITERIARLRESILIYERNKELPLNFLLRPMRGEGKKSLSDDTIGKGTDRKFRGENSPGKKNLTARKGAGTYNVWILDQIRIHTRGEPLPGSSSWRMGSGEEGPSFQGVATP